MNKPARIRLVLLLLIAAGLAAYALWTREPAAQGRPLSAWLADLVILDLQHTESSAVPNSEARRQKAVSAIREIGPRALPRLLQALRSAPPKPMPMHDALERLLGLQSRFQIPLGRPRDPWDQVQLAIAGFEVLGPVASPALPELGELLLDRALSATAAACLRASARPLFRFSPEL